MTDDLVEILARAIYITAPGPDGTEIFLAEPWRSCIESARACLAEIAAAGYAVVPAEPTEAMNDAARDWSHEKYGRPIGTDASKGCWSAMLAASRKV